MRRFSSMHYSATVGNGPTAVVTTAPPTTSSRPKSVLSRFKNFQAKIKDASKVIYELYNLNKNIDEIVIINFQVLIDKPLKSMGLESVKKDSAISSMSCMSDSSMGTNLPSLTPMQTQNLQEIANKTQQLPSQTPCNNINTPNTQNIDQT